MSVFDRWNARGRAVNSAINSILTRVIDQDGDGDDFPEDDREASMGDEVLAHVVKLNAEGRWREARGLADPAHAPFIPHMKASPLGLSAVAMLSADAFLVRRGDWYQDVAVLHLDGDNVRPLPGVLAFALSRNRLFLAMAHADSGITVTRGLGGPVVSRWPWPDGAVFVPHSMDVDDSGQAVVLANDQAGVLLGRPEGWTVIARAGEDDDDDEEDGEEEEEGASLDACHAALSPDGQFVAYGWQDGGHFVEALQPGQPPRRWAGIEPQSDYPYWAAFTDDSRQLALNSRHRSSGITLLGPVAAMRDAEHYGDQPELTAVDEYLRVYGGCFLPPDVAGRTEGGLWLGGLGWSHAAPLTGGKPLFTHFFGSALNAFDFDPDSRRMAVASASGMLHVVDPCASDDTGVERGYRARREFYRWIFWDTLDAPLRW